MHHTLRFYRENNGTFLRLYMLGAGLTRLPLVGRLVRAVANSYGHNQHTSYALTLAEAQQVVDLAQGLALGPCRCRQVFHHCHSPAQAEIVIGAGAEVFPQLKPDEYEPLTRERARALLELFHRQGLFHTLMRCRGNFYALCNCCHCCCVPTRLRAGYGIRGTMVKTAGSALPPELAGVESVVV